VPALAPTAKASVTVVAMLQERDRGSVPRVYVRTAKVRDTLGPAVSEHSEDVMEPVPEYNLKGLSAMEARAQAIVEQSIDRAVPRSAALGVIGGISTVVWIALSLGPLWAIYGQFLAASGAVLSGAAAPAWDAYPAPSFSMLFVTVLLVFAPVFLLAMLALVLTIRARIVNPCADHIQKATHEAFVGLTENGLVGSCSDASLHQAVSLLRREIRVSV
jgi:hypothetical protein